MKKNLFWIIGAAIVAYFLLVRKKPAVKSPVQNSGTAGARPWYSDFAAGVQSIYSGANNPDNTPQLVNSISNALSSVWKGFNGAFSTSSNPVASTPRTDTSIGAGIPVDFGNSVSSEDLSTPGFDWLDWSAEDYYSLA